MVSGLVEVGHQSGPAAVPPHADPDVVVEGILHVPPVAAVVRLLGLELEVAREDRLVRARIPIPAPDVLRPAVARVAGAPEAARDVAVDALVVDREVLRPGAR